MTLTPTLNAKLADERQAILELSADKARSALSAPVSQDGWLPIETAPRDHHVILVRGPYGTLTAFRDATWEWWQFPATAPLGYTPTKWHPLPADPKE